MDNIAVASLNNGDQFRCRADLWYDGDNAMNGKADVMLLTANWNNGAVDISCQDGTAPINNGAGVPTGDFNENTNCMADLDKTMVVSANGYVE